jgi:hypothetical protein
MAIKPHAYELVFRASLASFHELDQEDYTVLCNALEGALEVTALEQNILTHITGLQLRGPIQAVYSTPTKDQES